MKTGLDLPIGSDADPVTVGTEVCTYRADEADVSLCVRKPVELGNPAVCRKGTELRQTVGYDGIGDEGFRAKISAVIHGHEFNKSDVNRVLFCQCCEYGNLIIVESADEHGIDLDLLKPGCQGGIDPGERISERTDPGDVMELLRIQSIQADVQPADAGFTKRSGELWEQSSVGCKSDFFDPIHRSGSAAEFDNVALDQGLSAGDA